MKITRQQYESTEISELSEATCSELLGAGTGDDAGYFAWYLKANTTWYRFFIQHGTLFWDTSAPDPEDDLDDGEVYYDVFQDLRLQTVIVDQIAFVDGCLTIGFVCGIKLTIEEDKQLGSMMLEVSTTKRA